jgi:hypothetical protein
MLDRSGKSPGRKVAGTVNIPKYPRWGPDRAETTKTTTPVCLEALELRGTLFKEGVGSLGFVLGGEAEAKQ